ncbi:glycosyltransferase family 2 protein [Tepidimicrobium xylanilyticum]|uniref:Glycosyl transferase family 2 n=1 Tax=Tepidimicrobium xylanilyticum TaxID=1123352 RepID=A0A1H3CTG7_9FIRM|nr:glycosyltransferase family 2 protein [Tepidimicrobium xylanilyticum]GMG97731.1 glycosyl transferase [Tepidimicrobium xylanilyticum]SDX57350.1 Glycosyl transferase family 2 [Tepidimicrobium xylanilyticum]
MDNKKVLIVVPVYNEEDRIEATINGLKKVHLIDEILIIDDGSTDNTVDIVKRLNVNLISLPQNRGKGYAMRKAIKEMEYDYIGFIDGDLGESSFEVKKLIEPVLLNEVDFTIAKFPKPSANTTVKGGFGLVKKLAKWGVYYYTGNKMDTSLSGQRVYKGEIMESIKYIPDGYGIEIAMTIQALKGGYRYKEVPVNMTHRYTDRSIKGFIHRGKQFISILKALTVLFFRR